MVSQTPLPPLFRSSSESGNPDPDGRPDSRLRGNERWAPASIFPRELPKHSVASVVFPVLAGLGHG